MRKSKLSHVRPENGSGQLVDMHSLVNVFEELLLFLSDPKLSYVDSDGFDQGVRMRS